MSTKKSKSLSGRSLTNFRFLAIGEDMRALEKWIKKTERLSKTDEFGWTPLFYAVNDQRLEAVEMILKNYSTFDINAKDDDGETALTIAVINFSEAIPSLLKAGADPNVKLKAGYTALLRAAIFGKTDVFGELLKYGADPEVRDLNGTPLKDLIPAKLRPEFEVWLEKYLLNKSTPKSQSFSALKVRL